MASASEYDTAAQRQALLHATNQLGQLTAEQQEWCDSACLSRYLRARKGNISKAAKLLHSTLTWRSQINVGSLRISEFQRELASGKMYVYGNSEAGRSILVTRKKSDAFQPGDYDHYLRHLTFTLETACRNMKGGAESWVWIMDMAGMTRANSPPISVSMATLNIMADHFPERLFRCYFVDAPGIFSYLWAALSPFIDAVTKKKIVFLKSADWRKKMEGQAATPLDAGTDAAADVAAVPPEDDFSHYWKVYNAPYDEAAYRQLLSSVGWPE